MSTSNPNPVNIAVEFIDQKFLIESHTIDLVLQFKVSYTQFSQISL